MAELLVFAVMIQFCLTLTILVHAQNPSGFLNIDCGLEDEHKSRDDNTKLIYESDKHYNYIESGESHSVSPEYKNNSLERQFWNVRSFPDGKRNCYSFDTYIPDIGDVSRCIIRARFLYGNYDRKNLPPRFDLYLGSTFWDSVEFENASTIVTKEFHYTAGYDYIHVCLHNTNQGTPFISVLERRAIVDNINIYDGIVLARYNLGSDDGKIVRYPEDGFDRIWTPYTSHELYNINTSDPEKIQSQRDEYPPSTVMATAAIPANGNYITLKFHPRFNASTYFSALYFTEIQKLRGNQIREFEVTGNGQVMNFVKPYSPPPFQADYYSLLPQEEGVAAPKDGWQIWINRTRNSTLPPILNAIEMIQIKEISVSRTERKDYEAVKEIKRMYGIKRNWYGDPCTPSAYMWEGLNCSNSGSETDLYRITHLDLSSSDLDEVIAPSISSLTHLRYLDLSNNKLIGNVPESLAKLESLTFLNIEGNKLTGTVPAELIKRSNHTKFQFSWGRNPDLCYPGPCEKKHKNKVVILVAATFGGAFIVALSAITFFIFKKRKQVGKNPNAQGFYSSISKRPMLLSNINKVRSKKQRLTYAEILSITNNFERIVGKGGFGTVYHGQLGNTQVAVKMLFPSTQGFQQFQSEANLLTRVHHKCLTPLLGYCHEDSNIALIYEYMPNGDLAKYLSGLEYLHNGCKPPIIHRDIKPRNILLNEKMRGKIADFGLSKIFPEGDTHVFTVIAGTPGYLAPEYYASNRLNEKSDVFSFGVVLLELITGQPAITKTKEKTHIIQWVGSMLLEREIHDIVDTRLQGEFDIDSARKALDTAMASVAPISINRPSMSQVAMELKQCLVMEMTQDSDVNGCTSNSFAESDTSNRHPLLSADYACKSFSNMSGHYLFTVFQLFLTLRLLVHAQDQSDFLSLDCGLEDELSYKDNITNLTYQSDKGYTESGVSNHISSEYKSKYLDKQFWYVRSFPVGNRNCYFCPAHFSTVEGGTHYLVRARFMYGNYDHNKFLPKFDIYVGTRWWDTVEIETASSIITKEVIYTTQSDHIEVCLCNINKGTPFISVLELRPFTLYQGTDMELFARFDLGSQDSKIVRYPDDGSDRIWTPYNSVNWTTISAPKTEVGKLDYQAAPARIMKTAATSGNGSDSMYLRLSYNASSYVFYIYFAEVQKLNKSQIREFDVTLNGGEFLAYHYQPQYLGTNFFVVSNYSNTYKNLELQFKRTSGATLPPILNAIEIYMMKDLRQRETNKADHDVIKNIKSTYEIDRNWHGDPCIPEDYMWEGLNCSYAQGSGTPKITYLNLSSRGLTGNIDDDISFLKSIEVLDLSHNNLTGEIPDSLSQLNNLQVLKLEGNNLRGTIPQQLLEKSEKGLLKLSCHGNQNLCCPGFCKERRRDSKTTVVIPLVASLGGAFLLIAAITCWIIKIRKPGTRNALMSFSLTLVVLVTAAKTLHQPSFDFPLSKGIDSDKQQFTYDEVKSISNNFGRMLGTGGFGTVYHGYIGNTQVAVKMLSPSAHGYLQFQAEAELLTRVHHKCLTSLIGYCEEGTNVALIYEYMENGDLAYHLSGLEYLHNGCKPPIVHRDIKPQNILLSGNMRAKLADFGLSKIFTDEGETHVSTAIAGTLGYLDPEYFMSNRLNEKSDVFSFGVVLLEIITGQPAITRTEENTHITQRFSSMADEEEIHHIIDSRLQGEFNPNSAREVLNTAMACVAPTSMDRPTMSQVVMELKQCLGMVITSTSHNHSTVPDFMIDVSFDMISGESSLAR
ncbi:putative LRR receptor-like serine/threonine-protein kinase [Senna tora]|uniref:Putative LRR receptor-like serine/threonine-protein kinase n=1 Tax=Senna tora TaxID=362788 RepID=A0A834XF54_9FABA|nr:putative LRR receptor-like serine/threonine-protein kinase [Senna tora]